jgi:hypothetical protein
MAGERFALRAKPRRGRPWRGAAREEKSMMDDNNDLIGRVTAWALVKLEGKEEAEMVRYRITGIDDAGLLEGVCVNEDARLNGRIRKEMFPDRVRKGLLGEVISLDAERAKRCEFVNERAAKI